MVNAVAIHNPRLYEWAQVYAAERQALFKKLDGTIENNSQPPRSRFQIKTIPEAIRSLFGLYPATGSVMGLDYDRCIVMTDKLSINSWKCAGLVADP